ncbi:MAG: prepilin-type N-terminal cleavage/methylation domain-containing protein [Methanothermobacter sp.]|nr:prepilin-type N-terminal cleavage/methylation domain-containing protein [Methanothermobacter sp.]
MRKERKMKGFTLVELLIVLLILGILIGLAVPRYLQALEQSRKTTFCSNVRIVISAIETWRMDNATTAYPATATDLNDDIINSATYFSQPPMNPYDESATLTAVDYNQVDGGAKGQFGYKADPINFTYTVTTVPDCGLK